MGVGDHRPNVVLAASAGAGPGRGGRTYSGWVSASVLPVLAGALGAVGALSAAVALGGYLVYRTARRRWRLVRDHAAMRGALATWDGVRALRRARMGRVSSAAWSPSRARREIWWSVGEAEHAVDHARSRGAPIADLPSLCRRLRRSAEDLDRLVALDPTGQALRPQVDQLLSAATDIRLAAVAAAGECSAPELRALAEDAEREFRCLAEGLARSRAVTAPS